MGVDGVRGTPMKRISNPGLVATLALASSAAVAQDLSAGKTPAQLFGSDCSACHRTPGGLAKNRDVQTLTAFLRQHYTTNPKSAARSPPMSAASRAPRRLVLARDRHASDDARPVTRAA